MGPCWTFVAARQLLIAVASLGCGAQSLGAWAQWLRSLGSVAVRPVGSSRTRDGTRVPYIGRRILNPWTSREVQEEGLTKPPTGGHLGKAVWPTCSPRRLSSRFLLLSLESSLLRRTLTQEDSKPLTAQAGRRGKMEVPGCAAHGRARKGHWTHAQQRMRALGEGVDAGEGKADGCRRREWGIFFPGLL